MERQTPKVRAFLAEIEALMEKHQLDILHEDGHGAFEIADREGGGYSWIDDAFDRTEWDAARDGQPQPTLFRIAFVWRRTGDYRPDHWLCKIIRTSTRAMDSFDGQGPTKAIALWTARQQIRSQTPRP
jgi:hypothetical protein